MSEEWRNELITKGAAFDALTEIENQYEFEDGHDHLMRWAKTKIFALPSAQPEKRTEKRTETHARDLISRSAAIEALDALCDRECEYSKQQRSFMCGACRLGSAFDVIDELPSAQPEDIARDIATIIENEKDMRVILDHQWIPCSERLPKKRDWYLGIFAEPDTGWINPLPFICDYLLGKKTKATTKEGWILRGYTDREEHIDYYFNLKCVAWMPLPEPWRGEQNGKNS